MPGDIIVQKYGGTSVGSVDKIKLVAKRIKRQHSRYQKIAVVVSAMSGETNRLVSLIEQVNPSLPKRSYDMAVAAGEQVSVALMAAALEGEGLWGVGLLASQIGIYTTSSHAKARIETIDCEKLHEIWSKQGIPVIAGFQGVTKSGELTTLGRGGSDTSAVALACALSAAACEINTDVEGVYTADPRVVPAATRVPELDFELALEMASLGSKVLHNRCVELAAKYQMPLVVRSTFNENEEVDTKIMSFSEKQKLEAPVVSGVTLDRNVVRVTVGGLPSKQDLISKIFVLIAESGVNVDVIVHNQDAGMHRVAFGFTVGVEDIDQTKQVLNNFEKREGLDSIDLAFEADLAKISVVGLGMISHPGVASRVFEVLSSEGVELKMISTSEIKISCVIGKEKAEAAARALHRAFIQ